MTTTPQQVNPKRMRGTVVSNSMQKTLVVEVNRLVMHPVYKKRHRISKRYKAHYEGTEYGVGDVVQVQETRPMSKGKNWIVIGGTKREGKSEK
jgi:small subunit ribosomal protein S17